MAAHKSIVAIDKQLEAFFKSFTPFEAQPRYKLGKLSARTDWNVQTAIKDGYNASAVVYAAVEKRAKLLASVPWYAATVNRDGDLEKQPSSDLQSLIDNPNPDQSMSELIYTISQQVDLAGDAILTKIRNASGKGVPQGLWAQQPKSLKISFNDKQIDSYKIDKKDPIKSEEVVHLKTICPSSQVFGQPVLMAAGRATDIDRQGSDWQKNGLENRGIPDLIMQVPEGTNPGTIDKIRERFRQFVTGPRNAREPIVTSGDIKTIGQSAAEMDFINSRKSVWTEIAAAFGVPLAALGFTENVNLANAKEMNRMIWTDTIIPLLDLYKAQLQRQLAKEFGPQWRICYDLSNVAALQDNLDAKLANAERLLRMGYTRNEINQRLDLGFEDDPEFGDIRYEPAGMIPVGTDIGDEDTDSDPDELRSLGYGN